MQQNGADGDYSSSAFLLKNKKRRFSDEDTKKNICNNGACPRCIYTKLLYLHGRTDKCVEF